eukprot:scaffold1554_cov332-Pavlova_lutheri.AAC.3
MAFVLLTWDERLLVVVSPSSLLAWCMGMDPGPWRWRWRVRCWVSKRSGRVGPKVHGWRNPPMRATSTLLKAHWTGRKGTEKRRKDTGRGMGSKQTIGTMGKRWMDGKRNDTKAAATNTEDGSGRTGKGAPWLSIASVMGFSVLNRVTYKMALVPLANHIFFLAQFMTVSYVLIYSITLYVRYKRGWVTQEMLDVPKKTLVLAGMFEAVGLTLGLLGASGLPGAVLPVFSQLILIWQLILSYTVLGRKYPFAQLVGIAMVAIGVATAAIPGDSSVTLNVSSCATYLIVYILSLGFPSVATIFKEKVFKDAKAALGRDLDIFVVNTYSSVFQGIGVLLFLPVISRLQGVSFRNIPSYMSEGFYCFIGQGSAYGMDSTGAPFFPLLYMGMNLVFNISVLRLLRSTSSVISSMVLSTTIPLTILAFMVQLPLLPAPRPVGPMFWPGVGILFLGLGIYNFHKGASSKEKQG